MKAIYLLAFVATFAAAYVYAGLTPAQAMKHVLECKKKLNLTEAEFYALAAAETFDVVKENSKCFFNCFQESEGTLIDGVIQEQKVLDLFEGTVGVEKARKIYDECSKEKGAEKCETAFKLQVCYRKNGLF